MKYRPEEGKRKVDRGYSMKKKTMTCGEEEDEVGQGSMLR